jgi:hypothetical protein
MSVPAKQELVRVRTVDQWTSGGVVFEEVDVTDGESLPWHDHPCTYIDLWLCGRMSASWHSDVRPQVVSVLPAGVMHRSLTLSRVRTFQLMVPQTQIESLSQ